MQFLSGRFCLSRLIAPDRLLRHEFSEIRPHKWTLPSSAALNVDLPHLPNKPHYRSAIGLCRFPHWVSNGGAVHTGGWRSCDSGVQRTFFANCGDVRYLRTGAWRTHPAAVESGSSPIRSQTRLFADIDRSTASEKNGDGKKVEEKADTVAGEEDSKLTLAQRFKKMWKQYWYVLVPVHAVTCCAWLGLFYGISASGLDVVSFLEFIHTPEVLLNKIRNAPQAGYAVVAFALYKIATPLRYMTTLGVTYYAVKTLSRLGYIKPMPSGKQIKAMIDVKRDEFRERRHRWRQERRFLIFKKRHSTTSSTNGHHRHHHVHHPKRKKDD